MRSPKNIIYSLEIVTIFIIMYISYQTGVFLGESIIEIKNGPIIAHLNDYNKYELPTQVFDINGKKITEFTSLSRKLVYYNELPKNLIDAFIIAEDKRFFSHFGIDFYGLFRALLRNIQAGRIVEGGSTISQQLAKLFFTNKKKTFKRKVLEIKYALILENRFTKKQILERYLNKIYFGHGVYGVGAASQYFFAKKVKDLNVVESVMLASIPSNPSRFSPFQNRRSADIKLRLILDRIVKGRYASSVQVRKEYSKFWDNIQKRAILVSSMFNYGKRKDKAPYFSEYVRILVERYLIRGLNLPKEYLYSSGLKIYTTLDLKKQKMARLHLEEQLNKQDHIYRASTKKVYSYIKNKYTDLYSFIGLSFIDSKYFFRKKQKLERLHKVLRREESILDLSSKLFALDDINGLINRYIKTLLDENMGIKAQGALVSIDPSTGYIVAMVGGRRFSSQNQYNRAILARRQPGSTFKAFLYGAAFKARLLHPNTIVRVKEDPPITDVHAKYDIQAHEAIKFSINDVAVNIINNIGAKRVIDFASTMLGIPKSRLPSNPSLALGSGEVTPLELCRGIAVYANDGKEVRPIAVLRIVDRYGRVIKDFENDIRKEQLRQLISPKLARLMTGMLSGVVTDGTGAAAVMKAGFDRPSAGKTGSTNDHKDAWFVGYTPNLVTAVWIGFDKGMSLGHNQYGSVVAAPVWSKFMRDAHKDLPEKFFITTTSYFPLIKMAPWLREEKRLFNKDYQNKRNESIVALDLVKIGNYKVEKLVKGKKVKSSTNNAKKVGIARYRKVDITTSWVMGLTGSLNLKKDKPNSIKVNNSAIKK